MLDAFKDPIAFGAILIVAALLAYQIIRFIISLTSKEEVKESTVEEHADTPPA